MNIINKPMAVTFFLLLGWSVLGLISPQAYAETEEQAELLGDYKLTYERLCGLDIPCLVVNYCTGCHSGLVVGATVVGKGRMKPAPGNLKEWESRLERMSVMGCHIPKLLLRPMAAYLDGLDNAPLTKEAKASAQAVAEANAKAVAQNPGKYYVDTYCIGCHDGLMVGTTVVGAGRLKPKPKTYDEWVDTIQLMSERPSARPPGTAGAHIPPALIPGMAAYLDSLDNAVVAAPDAK